MMSWVLLAALMTASDTPQVVNVTTSRGSELVVVDGRRGFPALPHLPLTRLLPFEMRIDDDWATGTFADQPVRFLLDAPVYTYRDVVNPLTHGAYAVNDTVFVPLQWMVTFIPREFGERYWYDPLAASFEEVGITPTVVRTSAPGRPFRPAPEAAARLGLREAHKVVLDPGHGGHHPGNPGRFFPRGVQEKHVNLAVSLMLRDSLQARGIEVAMTRTRDVHVELTERGPQCGNDCDLFLSIHVNSLRRLPGYERVGGVETFFIDHNLTTDPKQISEFEYADDGDQLSSDDELSDPLSFIQNALARNEFLLESSELAGLVQDKLGAIHPNGSRRVGAGRLAVLRTASRPAILVEMGFATNRRDARFLMSDDGRGRIAQAIADSIVEYLLNVEQRQFAPAR